MTFLLIFTCYRLTFPAVSGAELRGLYELYTPLIVPTHTHCQQMHLTLPLTRLETSDLLTSSPFDLLFFLLGIPPVVEPVMPVSAVALSRTMQSELQVCTHIFKGWKSGEINFKNTLYFISYSQIFHYTILKLGIRSLTIFFYTTPAESSVYSTFITHLP